MRIIFVRHAEPDYANDTLTEKGWREAALLAERVSGWDVTDFYVSPLGRARDTASLSLKKMGRTAEIFDWLREFHGPVNDPTRGENGIFIRNTGRKYPICTIRTGSEIPK